MDPKPICNECAVLTEKLRRAESQLKRATADLLHLKATGTVQRREYSQEIADTLPDPDPVPEPTNPAQRFVKRPPLEF